tara:strand:- start:281 stop:520 length:240 start_codon:yes stop_codon:yes gene_type:complete
MKIEESEQGATPEELVELVEGFFLFLSKHRLWELAKDITDDETEVNLHDRAVKIYQKLHPELEFVATDEHNGHKTSSPE